MFYLYYAVHGFWPMEFSNGQEGVTYVVTLSCLV